MGMFSYRNSFVNESTVLDESAIVAQECTEENSFVSAMRVVAESEYNWNQIMQAVAIEELCSYEATGSDEVVNEGAGFFTAVKEFFKKLLEKVKGIFVKFISVIDSWSKSDKEFVKKYKKAILNADAKDFEYEGYVFTVTASPNNDRAAAKKAGLDQWTQKDSTDKKVLEDATAELKGDKLEEKLEEFRAEILKEYATGYKGTKIDSSDFSKEVFEALRNGESSKDTLDNINKLEQLNIIENTEDTKKKVKKYYDNVVKGINDAIKDIETVEKATLRQVPKEDPDGIKSAQISYAGAVGNSLRNQESIHTVVYGAAVQALKDQNRQAKAICVKLMSRKSANESTSFYEEGSLSPMSNINLI